MLKKIRKAATTKHLTAFFAAMLLLSHSPALSAQDNDLIEDASFSVTDCHVQGSRNKVTCYELMRPFKTNASDNRTTKLGGVIIPSRAVTPLPDPLIVLAGGPGQSASELLANMLPLFSAERAERDIIFFDIRGTGRSSPIDCDGDETAPPLTHISEERLIKDLQACLAHQKDNIPDNTSEIAASDIEALRLALNLGRVNLWGVSYGTRLAQYYVKSYPEQVRSLILDGVVSFNPSYLATQPKNALASLDALTKQCANDSLCNSAFPNFNPLQMLDSIEDGIEISYPHPVTGAPIKTTTSRTAIAQTTFSALYRPESRSLLPWVLTSAQQGSWAPMANMALDIAPYMGITNIYMDVHLNITCAEEADTIFNSAAQSDPFIHEAGRLLLKSACSLWPSVESKQSKDISFFSDVPTLMLSGALDPITPPHMAETAMENLPNTKHILFKNGGHMNSDSNCVDGIMSAFLTSLEPKELDISCIDDSYQPMFVTGLLKAKASVK